VSGQIDAPAVNWLATHPPCSVNTRQPVHWPTFQHNTSRTQVSCVSILYWRAEDSLPCSYELATWDYQCGEHGRL